MGSESKMESVPLAAGSMLLGVFGNILWLIFGGFLLFLSYVLAGFLLCLTIIGIPFGFQILKLSGLMLWPFGRKIVYAQGGTGCFTLGMNVIWLLFFGLWIALEHLLAGLLLICTIIGIPFGLQHFKLAALALAPFGATYK